VCDIDKSRACGNDQCVIDLSGACSAVDACNADWNGACDNDVCVVNLPKPKPAPKRKPARKK
jgi:hypothetical protein